MSHIGLSHWNKSGFLRQVSTLSYLVKGAFEEEIQGLSKGT